MPEEIEIGQVYGSETGHPIHLWDGQTLKQGDHIIVTDNGSIQCVVKSVKIIGVQRKEHSLIQIDWLDNPPKSDGTVLKVT